MVLRFLYLDGSGQVGSRLAEVHEAGNGYPIGQIVDKGHIVDQVVCLSNAQDEYGGNALWEVKIGLKVKYIFLVFLCVLCWLLIPLYLRIKLKI